MSIDPSKLSATLATEAKKTEDLAYRRTGKVTDKFFNRVMMSDTDPTAKAVEIILGITEGDTTEVASLLGIVTNGDTVADTPAALPAPAKPRILPLYDADGNPEGTGLPEEEAFRLGYQAVLDPASGEVVGYKKPKVATPAPAPVPTGADRQVDVKNSKGHVIEKVKISDGISRTDLEAKLDADGAVEYFVEKPRFVRRGK